MADRVCTRFIDDDGLDIGCHLVSKEYVLEAYPELVPWMKNPALWSWGCGTFGRFGNNANFNTSSPVQTISAGTNWKQICPSSNMGAAVKTDGSLWIWGSNYAGILGNQTASTITVSSPVQTISGGTNWKSVSTGYNMVSGIKTDGSLWLWGSNNAGILGTNNVVSRSSPVQTISNVTTWKQISNGFISSAIKTDGTLWTWGSGYAGLPGRNDIIARSSPVQTISVGTNWKRTSASCYHVSAIKTDGTLWLWGANSFGRLGNNSVANASTPIQTISGGTNWKQVSLGNKHSAAIKTDGTLWTWGYGLFGVLGTQSEINRSSPAQTVSGGTNWNSVSVGSCATAAIKTDGTLWIWGNNSTGALGTNSVVNASSPVQTVTGGTNWRSVVQNLNTTAIEDESDL